MMHNNVNFRLEDFPSAYNESWANLVENSQLSHSEARSMLALGDEVPDFRFVTDDGRVAPLSELATGPCLMIFLRHLG
jgi:hypothetical protein